MKNRKMKIWIFNHYAILPNYPGGTRHFGLSKYMVEKGHHVTVFASNFIHMNFQFVKLDTHKYYKREQFEHLDFIWLKSTAYQKNNWKRLINMLSYCRSAKKVTALLLGAEDSKKPDVIIGSTVHPFAALTAAHMARKLQVPFIYEIRDLWPQSFLDIGIWKKYSWQSILFKYIEKRTIANAQKIIAMSPRTEGYLHEQYNYPKENICYIPNGVYIVKNRKKTTVRNQTLEFLAGIKKEKKFLVMYSGSLISTNKLETIIDAAYNLQNQTGIKFVLIGKGQDENRYQELINHKNLKNIFILPPVPKKYVPDLLDYADVLILNQGNVQWGSSNKLYDYLASGKPIISCVYAKHNDIVNEIGGGVSSPPGDSQELIKAILQFQQMAPDVREKMGQKNISYVENNHDWKILGDRLLKLLESV